MHDDVIAPLLRREYPDPETGLPLDVKVQSVVIDATLDGREIELVRALDLGDRLAVVSDPDTHAALGARVARALGAAFRVQEIQLGAHPRPDEATVAALQASVAPGTDALIAVGSGTINDLCKLVAARLGRPYAVFGTAPSMNGYASVAASIVVGGLKQSLPARAPAGVFLDLGVLSRAPLRLIRGGLGDSLCRPTAQCDWLLAHLLRGDAYREAPFVLLATEEDELFAHSDALVAGDIEAVGRLARTLVLSGFGMTICGGSYPASQGEHLISHYMDMMQSDAEPHTHHGEQIGVGTLVMAELQERILAMDSPPVLCATRVTERDVVAHFGPSLGPLCWRQLDAKRLGAERAEALNAVLAARWDQIRARIATAARPASELCAVLQRAGAPVSASDLGWSLPRFRDACIHARELRQRFTFLDLAADSDVPIVP